jgi:hypothetical protein
MADAGRARWWTRAQAVAWIVWRNLERVRRAASLEQAANEFAAKTEKRPVQVLPILAADAESEAAGELRNRRAIRMGRVFAGARLLRILERRARLAPTEAGFFSSLDVRRLFPPPTGRGKGRAPKDALELWKVKRLGFHFLMHPKSHNTFDFFDWCRDEGLVANRDQYAQLRARALKWAEAELALRKRSQIGFRDWTQFSSEEIAACEGNLASWRQQGRPRKPARV